MSSVKKTCLSIHVSPVQGAPLAWQQCKVLIMFVWVASLLFLSSFSQLLSNKGIKYPHKQDKNLSKVQHCLVEFLAKNKGMLHFFYYIVEFFIFRTWCTVCPCKEMGECKCGAINLWLSNLQRNYFNCCLNNMSLHAQRHKMYKREITSWINVVLYEWQVIYPYKNNSLSHASFSVRLWLWNSGAVGQC